MFYLGIFGETITERECTYSIAALELDTLSLSLLRLYFYYS